MNLTSHDHHAALAEQSQKLSDLFSFVDIKNFMPHGHCYLWIPELVWLHVISDIIITLAYYSIPIALVYFVKKRKDVPYPWIFSLFALFILLCGTTHLFEVWNLWNSSYWLSGYLKAATAFVSILTAMSLIPLLPKFLMLRSASELEKINTDLVNANLQATEATRSKSTFLASMSHEIRTPMNGILGICNITLDSKLDPEQRENLELIKSSAQSLMSTINDILDFSKLESEKIKIEKGIFDLHKLLHDTEDFFKFQFREKGLNLFFKIDSQCPKYVISDSDRIRQVLVNLIGNALKFTDSGDVTVNLQFEKDEFIFCVKDTGIGIPENKVHLLFNPFSQVDQSSHRIYKGSGLGLSICKKIVLLMNGTIDFYQNKPKGSHFCFKLPLQISDQTFFEKSVKINDKPVSLKRNNLRILVAEDNSTNQIVIQKMFENQNAVLDFCSNGLDVLNQLNSLNYDLILMDCQMPELDGYQTAEKIRNSTSFSQAIKKIPIIAFTADAMSESKAKALQSGMNDFITKPISKTELILTINKYL